MDFGRGFYTTTSYSQAYHYIPQAVKKYNFQIKQGEHTISQEDGRINVYRFHQTEELNIHYFTDADVNWLHYVSANRDHSLFSDILEKLETNDVIGGKIANDQTRRTLIEYITGAYGRPGTARADQLALEMLLPNRLQDQFCFRTEAGVRSLEFVRSERYGDSEFCANENK